ncbi:MAG: PQQ-like beta-propeller repeat protein [Verrucomicrobiales bacterium]|nr:PQQ-like beta-propeller repeat protein [Verrucomicrobiales bacterium]
MTRYLATLLAVSATLPISQAADWPQWRGPSRDATVPAAAKPWPSDLKNMATAWKNDLAEGYSSPIIAGKRVFTVETRDKKQEIARAFDRKSGKQLWENAWDGSMKVPFFAAKNGSWVRSTPATDGKSLFIGGMRDVLVALDADTGTEKWRVDYPGRDGTPVPSFGLVSSPLIDGDHLYIQAGAAITKVDKETGKTAWSALKDERAMYGSAFSSTTLATIHGKRQLVAQSRATLAGIDPGSGSVLWQTPVKAFRTMNILTPTVVGNQIFTSTYGGGSFLFDVKKDSEAMAVAESWNDPKAEGYMSTPVIHEGHAYLHGRDKKFHCIELSSGTVKWSTDEKFGDYWSTVINRDSILALDQKGELLLIKATPDKFTLLDRRRISDETTYAHLAVIGNELYVRSLKSIASFRWNP